ncbi:MAG: hypothetical protein HYU28_06895 [Actinobacteria bacterium]|nr:hypothetical protein [Actinomycetota bacterium]
MPISDLRTDRRKLLLTVAGAAVAIALIVVVLATVLGGGDGEGDGGPPPGGTLALTAPPDTSGIVGLDGQPAQLTPADLDAIVATIEGYLRDATITPLSQTPDETSTTQAGPAPLAAHFVEALTPRLGGDDALTLTDAHLGVAEDGVSTAKATATLAGLVQDGAAQFVNATIDVVVLAKGVPAEDDEVTIKRSGDLVLRPVEGGWKIAAYKLSVEREFGDRTEESQAASPGAPS